MKLSVTRRDLAPALAALSRIVEARNTIPILSNLALVAGRAGGEGFLRVVATDLDMEASVRLPARVDAEGATTLDAARLHGIVGKLPTDCEIDLEAAPGEPRARLRAGRARYDMPMLPIEDFPSVTERIFATAFDLDAATLAEALDATQFAISTEETRYYLNGVYLQVVEGALGGLLTVVATDGHRLAKWARQAPAAALGMPGVIVPRKAVKELAALAKGATDPARIEVCDERMRITIGATALSTKLIDGTYPDYGRVIPTGHEASFTVDRLALAASLDRVTTIQTGRGAAVAFDFADGRLELRARDPDQGDATEEMAADGDGAVTIGFNGRYVRDALASFDCDRIEIGLTDPGTPGLIRPANPAATAAERLVVIMPMRV